jgi:hypothetical protein
MDRNIVIDEADVKRLSKGDCALSYSRRSLITIFRI